MEILILVFLYYLSQNPDFSESDNPIMGELKNSEQMPQFLKNLSQYTQTFSTFKPDEPYLKKEANSSTAPPPSQKEKEQEGEHKKTPQSPTAGIADEFIEKILESYLKKR